MTKQRATAFRKLRYIFLTASCFILLQSVSAQKQTITYDTTIGGWNAKVTMRADMNYTKDSVQGIVFIPGTGECGTDITKLLIYGPHYWMTKGWDGSVTTAKGTEYPIIISLQPPSVNQRPTTLKTKIDDILKRYRIKRNSLHLTGISQGGWVVNIFATYKPSESDYSYYRMVKTLVNVQGVVPDDNFGSALKYPARFGNWAKVAGGKALWFEQANDGRKMAIGAQNMNDSVPGSATYFKTNFGAGKHSDFEKFYDPSAKWTMAAQPAIMTITGKDVNMNIYQWMLSQGESDPVPNEPQTPANQPPVAKAGNNITIRLPETSVKLNGSATDADGTIASYLWSQTSGPSTAEIVSASSATTNVNKLAEGKYVFRLTVKDDKGASAWSELTVTVEKAIEPIPDPGTGGGGSGERPPVYVGLGEYQAFLINKDGKLYGLSSSKSAVGAGTSSGSAVPPVPLAVPSNLTFKEVASGLHHSLAVDNNGEVWCWGWNEMGQAGNGTASDTKIYTPQKITQDANGAPFTNVVQVAAYYSYNKHSGNVALKSDGTLWIWGHTGGGMLGDGTDGEIKTRPVRINIPGNRAIKKIVAAEVIVALATDGTVWAWGGGGNRTQNLGTGNTDFRTPRQVVDLPTNIKEIAGASSFYYAVTTDGVPYGWGYFGVYLGIGTSYATNKPVSRPVNLSSYLNLPAPIKSIVCNTVTTHVILTDGTLWGWGDNAQGTIGNGEELDFMNYSKPYAWTFGPGQLMQAKPVNIIPEINNFTHIFGGTAYVYYKYALTADGKLYSWGRNKGGVIGNGVISGSSSIGATYPNAFDVPIATLVDPLSLKESTSQAASYCLLYPDATSCNTQKYTPGKPKVYAGEPQTINLPSDSVLLSGNAVSPNGPIVGYTWKKLSGPESVRFSTTERPTAAATKLTAGTYVFELTAKDYEGVTGTSTVTVIVNGAGLPQNKNPSAKAGEEQTITLPDNSVSLDGSESYDEDGNIVSYSWKKTAGPSTFAIRSPSVAKTTITGLNTAGTYTFELTVTDDKGASSKASVNVIVKPAPNVAPKADAGADQAITLPTTTVTLDGTGSSDSDGQIVSYSWTKVSGPATFVIASPTAVKTAVNNLTTVGTYVFELTVTDNSNAVAKDRITVTVNSAPNVAPTANAGSPVSITLPASTATIDGSGSTDSDGEIVSYKWTKVSGPATFNIVSPNQEKTEVRGLTTAGEYVFELSVTDDQNATATSRVTVTVNPAVNVPPVANAGDNISIALPESTVSLDASGSSDEDGQIVTYFWRKISGPTTYNITDPNSAKTTVTGLTTEGTYVFEVRVTDNDNATAKSSVTVTVSPAGNVPPYVYAGPDITITLPTSTANLDGSNSKDSDGSIVKWEWTKKSGPATFNIENPNAAKTAVTGLTTAGTYVFQLKVTDDDGAFASESIAVIVKPAPNVAPVAKAGSNVTITLPTTTANLDGSGSTDSDGQIVSYVWAKKSGPSTFLISNPASAKTSVTGLTTVGTYVFELTVTDNNGASSKAQVSVTVNPAPNVPPVANAGPNVTITLPTTTATIDGTASLDSDGDIVSYGWSKISGPATFVITSASAAKTTVTGLTTTGTYVFELTVTDNNGATSKAQVSVIVNPAPNVAPVAKAGSNVTITLPTTTANLDGSGSTDSDGQIVSYAWAKKSGPATFSITSPSAAKTAVTGLTTAGTYVFELTVTDNKGATSKAEVSVIVKPAANVAPIAKAGTNVTITLPTTSTNLDGSGSSDSDGQIVSFAWTKISGPATFSITSPSAAKTGVTGLTTTGTYVFQLTVKDNSGASASATVTVTVNPAPNVLPTAKAGSAITITQPASTTNLDGSGSSDSDGQIVSYSWTKKSGPATFTIANPNAAKTSVTGLTTAGTYIFELTVTDDRGGSASATVSVIVNIPPVANAGSDFAVTLPAKSIALDGSASNDPDGQIASYNWSKLSGPASHAFGTPTAAKTSVTGLETGEYVFELTVKDNRGAVAKDQVKVVVNAQVIPNKEPIANAGPDITVVLPTNYTELDATRSTDSDGSIVSYRWRQLNGPATAQIEQETSAVTTVSDLVEGIYEFEVTVTDNKGASAKSAVTIKVIWSDNRRYDDVFTIYPNPVVSAINIAYQSDRRDEQLTVLISDLAGRVVIRKSYSKSGNGMFTASIDATGLKTGMYFIRLMSDHNSKKPVYQKGFIKR